MKLLILLSPLLLAIIVTSLKTRSLPKPNKRMISLPVKRNRHAVRYFFDYDSDSSESSRSAHPPPAFTSEYEDGYETLLEILSARMMPGKWTKDTANNNHVVRSLPVPWTIPSATETLSRRKDKITSRNRRRFDNMDDDEYDDTIHCYCTPKSNCDIVFNDYT